MKVKYIIPVCLLLLSIGAQSQILRPFAARYTNTSVRGNIVYVSNNIITSPAANTSETPPGGTGVNNGNIASYIDADGGTTIFSHATTWKYLANNTRPANWQTVAFNDATWPTGTILTTGRHFGYGDNDEDVCIPYGCNSNICFPTNTCVKYITTLFRKQFTITGLASYSNMQISLYRDDGVVIYVNGTEVTRNNMPGGAVTNATLASAAAPDDGNTAQIITIPTTNFVEGSNTIAVELHQNGSTSTDLSFSLQLSGITANSTFSSSAADLNLATCSQILWAGLYWGASQGNDGTNTTWITGETSVKFKVPGQANYATLTSSQTDYHNGTLVPGLPHTGYRCYTNVTSLLNATSPNGTYWVGDVAGPNGIINGSGGWTLVIAYSNPSEVPRNLTVFDGSAIMNGGDPAMHVAINGFLTPPSGPVSCEIGGVVYDGDRVSVDEFSFKQNSNPLVGTYTNQTPNATSNLNDMWNSTISYKGSVVTSRLPAHANTLGYDADIIDVPNTGNTVLGNNQTSASVRFSAPSENYFIQVLTTSISVYSPSFAMDKGSTDLNGGSLVAGDILRYRINYQNVGNDASTNTIIRDNIPIATTLVPGSIKINGVTKTDASGDDQAHYDFVNRQVVFRLGTGANSTVGGTVASLASGYVEFDVYTAISCEILACGTPTNNVARIDYNGQTSGQSLFDSTGFISNGCLTTGPISNVITGTCFVPRDTLLFNICPSVTVPFPFAAYAGYSFYSGTPFDASTAINPAVNITQSGTYWAYFNSGVGCEDTIRIQIYINPCPDIDDDDDGLPDYLEINNPAALLDHDADGVLNYCDAQYPGFVDITLDGINDNFDPSGDSDNDGTPNFLDGHFTGYVDANNDVVNDNMDKDLDGIPNHLDRDCDNDGIPDVVESYGVDTNGDGKIDNYSDSDADGLSQNVDGNNTGPVSSGTALGALDTDSDGVPNYMDLDSDNDGIPDVVEAFGNDSGNDGKHDGYLDTDGDGYSDLIDGDVGNDDISENSAASLLRNGADGNGDGRTDSWPNKNFDSDLRANPYDVDADGDGVIDLIEAGFADADFNGQIDGAINSDGWNAAVASGGSLNLPNTDATGRVNVYDIDSDDDGIPDNVEGLSTTGYLLPAAADTDSDGLDNSYDNIVGFSGRGIPVNDQESDGTPDYLDNDTDNDGLIDRIEGNDLNLNGYPDENVTLTGVDTDSDGLDDRFDNNNSNVEATSARMGNGGTTTGDPTPGSITPVQRTATAFSCPFERDWRCIYYVLNCELISFQAILRSPEVKLDWSVFCEQEAEHFEIERSIDRINFISVSSVAGRPTVNATENYFTVDHVSGINAENIYYRLRTFLRNGRVSLSKIIIVRLNSGPVTDVQVLPNPVKDYLQLQVTSNKALPAEVIIINSSGAVVQKYSHQIQAGSSSLSFARTALLPNGTYYVRFIAGETILTRKFNLLK